MVKIGAVILAAGMSKRMGKQKLLLPLNGEPIFRHAVVLAIEAGLDPVILIAGQSSLNEMRSFLKGLDQVEIICNEESSKGMGTSLSLGLDRLKQRVGACLVFLADQPLITFKVINEIIGEYEAAREQGILIIRPTYKGKPGHPVLIDSHLFHQFDKAEGDKGGRDVINRFQFHLKTVPVKDDSVVLDIDTPEDYQKAVRIFKGKDSIF